MKKIYSLAIMATTVVMSLFIVVAGVVLLWVSLTTEQRRVALDDVLSIDRIQRDASLNSGSTKTSGQGETPETEQRVPLEEEYTNENP